MREREREPLRYLNRERERGGDEHRQETLRLERGTIEIESEKLRVFL